MVIRIGRGLPLTLSMLFLGALSAAHADGLLEQMQNEVSAIVKANKGGIVSIEDEGAMPPRRAGGNSDPRKMAEQKALVDHLLALQAQEDGVTVELTKASFTYKPAHPKIIALKHDKETVSDEVQKLSAELAKQPDAPQWQQFVQGVRLAQWTQIRTTLNTDLQKSLTVYKPEHPHVLELRQELHVAEDNILALTKQQQGRRGPSPFDRMNAPKSGSGFSIGNGYVVTTADVVEGMQHPLVITDDGTRLRVKLIGIDTELNLGLLQIPAKATLPALKIGDSDTVEAGHFAIAIGNQAGHANSVALTMVSGVRKEGTFTGERFYPALIQVAGTIGAGTSGAPILNARGEVVGVIVGVPSGEWTETQIYSDQPLGFLPGTPGGAAQPRTPNSQNPQPELQAQQSPGHGPGGKPFTFGQGQAPAFSPNGLPITKVFLRSPVTSAGFAIPINDLQFSIKELMTSGKIVHTWVGVDLRPERKTDDNSDIIKVMRFIRIRNVYPDSPAQKGGLQSGDILTELNSKPVGSMAEVRASFLRLHPAEKLLVTVQRNGMPTTVTLNIEVRPEKIVPPPNQPNRRPQ
ncbi:MAG: peptidase [Chthonomonadaceae bacterium]|nr:peptidase [Chthonomonadaceae bacterium]